MTLIEKFTQLPENEVGEFLKQQNLLKSIKLIDFRYKDILIYTIKNNLNKKVNSSIEPQDIYNDFLGGINKIILSFNQEKGATFKTFILKSLKNFTYMYNRANSTQKRDAKLIPIPSSELFDLYDNDSEGRFNKELTIEDWKSFIEKNKNFFDELKQKINLWKKSKMVTTSKINSLRFELKKRLFHMYKYSVK